MKVISWVRFTWDLAALPEAEADLPEHYQISAATQDDEKELRRVVSSSFSLDPDWNSMMHQVTPTIDVWLANALESDNNVGLVLRHGVRIIGASVLSLDPTADNHLSPGPCILMEYRNRGFGTRMLERSLQTLRQSGLTQANGIAKENSPVTKFLYPKFAGTSSAYESTPLVAA